MLTTKIFIVPQPNIIQDMHNSLRSPRSRRYSSFHNFLFFYPVAYLALYYSISVCSLIAVSSRNQACHKLWSPPLLIPPSSRAIYTTASTTSSCQIKNRANAPACASSSQLVRFARESREPNVVSPHFLKQRQTPLPLTACSSSISNGPS